MAGIKRAITTDGAIRAYCIDSTDIVQTAYEYHHTTPVATAALGRTLTMCAVMGSQLKGQNDSLTVLIKGDGPLGGIVACADSSVGVRGYVYNPQANVPNKKNGKLDVSGVIGAGYLSISRDLGLKEPYVGQVPLVTGEIAEDFTYYYALSEQVPTAISLGVLVDVDYTVKCAGGFMVQLMPGADESVGVQMEETVRALPPITTILDEGITSAQVLERLLAGRSYELLEDVQAGYRCDCSMERIERALLSLGRDELEDIIRSQGEAELTCQFCPRTYRVPRARLEQLLQSADLSGED